MDSLGHRDQGPGGSIPAETTTPRPRSGGPGIAIRPSYREAVSSLADSSFGGTTHQSLLLARRLPIAARADFRGKGWSWGCSPPRWAGIQPGGNRCSCRPTSLESSRREGESAGEITLLGAPLSRATSAGLAGGLLLLCGHCRPLCRWRHRCFEAFRYCLVSVSKGHRIPLRLNPGTDRLWTAFWRNGAAGGHRTSRARQQGGDRVQSGRSGRERGPDPSDPGVLRADVGAQPVHPRQLRRTWNGIERPTPAVDRLLSPQAAP